LRYSNSYKNDIIEAIDNINGDVVVKSTETTEVITEDITITSDILKELAFVKFMMLLHINKT
jgi:hypothetical protein